MSKIIHRISTCIGFTTVEVKVLLFLISMFILGYSYKIFIKDTEKNIRDFDYTYRDSLFLSAIGEGNSSTSEKITETDVDYKQEVLDFNKVDFNSPKKTEVITRKSINLNSATIQDLIKLPGIGEKTASAILEYRKQIGRFKFLEQLLDIKGIGSSKLNKIKEYIFIE